MIGLSPKSIIHLSAVPTPCGNDTCPTSSVAGRGSILSLWGPYAGVTRLYSRCLEVHAGLLGDCMRGICPHGPMVKATHLTALTFHRGFIFSAPHLKMTLSMFLGDRSIPKYDKWLKSTRMCYMLCHCLSGLDTHDAEMCPLFGRDVLMLFRPQSDMGHCLAAGMPVSHQGPYAPAFPMNIT